MVTTAALLAGLYPERDLKAYLVRQRCGPQPGMRRVEEVNGRYTCWLYEKHAWTRRKAVHDRNEALSWWLGDPWLPNHQFAYGIIADGADPGMADGAATGEAQVDTAHDATRWEEWAAALTFHIVMETGARPHDVGPESTETGAVVYQTLRARRAVAQIYWYEGRSRMDDLRAGCPVRTDVPPMLRCVVLAEAAVLLARRPWVETYLGIDDAPPGIAADAADVLRKFGLPRRAYHLLLR
jgi:hypothetical protein